MNSEKTVIRDTIFKPDIHGNGGQHRTAQIDELIKKAGLEVIDIEKNLGFSSMTKWQRYKNGIHLLKDHKFKIYPDYKMLAIIGFFYERYQHALTQHQTKKVLLWEATRGDNYIAPYAAKDIGFKVIALPQNIESLAENKPDFFTKKQLPQNLEYELKHLQKADTIFCISREEKWLLNLFNIESEYLPYYPPEELKNELLEIRKRRKNKEQKRFLMLGSATNVPTREGFIELISLINQLDDENIRIDIAGYGTETLAEYCNNSIFKLHGTVEPEQLMSLLEGTKALLIYQKSGAGALTKIPEMLIAGIPIIANGIACRSAFNYSGVYCYDELSQLSDFLTQNINTPPIITRQINLEQKFIDCIRN